MFRSLMLTLGLPLALSALAPPGPRMLRVAAASDLRSALERLRPAFQQEHPELSVEASFGASGALLTQIRQGAPFDVYLAADMAYPEELAREQLTRDAVFPYAEGRLTLWVRKGLDLDPSHDGLKVLLDPRVKRIALANPSVAPYGRAAVEALLRAGLRLESKLLKGENVAQAAQYLQSGAADAGLISSAQAGHPALREAGTLWPLPLDSYPKLRQGGAILKRCAVPDAARAFRDFLLGAKAQAILAQDGYGTP